MRNKLYVDGTDLSTFGVYISGDGTFSAPEKEYTWYDIPARNGSVLGYERRLQNIEVSYECFIYTNFDTNIANLRSFLLSRDGLVRIADTYHTTEFRMGVYSGPFEPSVERKLDAGKFVLTFNCLPQRWLTSGEATQTWTSGTLTLTNSTLFTAKPMLRVYGYGNFSITNNSVGVQVEIDDYSDTYIDIDCETMNCYKDDTNLNSFVGFREAGLNSLYGVDAPTLPPGTNLLAASNGHSFTKIEVTPRWWTL